MTINSDGRNPYALARHISSTVFPCPICGSDSRLIPSVSGDSIDVVAECPSCGKVVLDSGLAENADVVLEYGGKRCPVTPDLKLIEGKDGIHSSDDARLFLIAGKSAIKTICPESGIKMLEDVCEACYSNLGNPGWDGAEEICVESAIGLAEVFYGMGKPSVAVELMNRFRDVAEKTDMVAEYVCYALRSQAIAGEPSEGLKDLRAVIKNMAERPYPHDPRIVSMYCELGTVLENKPDLQAAFKAYGTAVKEAYKISPITEDSLSDLLKSTSEYARVSISIHQEKKGTEAVRNALKLCRDNRDAFPRQYAKALIKKAKHIIDMDAIDPGMKDYLDEAIGILESSPDARDDPLIPIAWYYRSASSGKRDSLDLGDMAKAYECLRDGLLRGVYPDDMIFSVTGTYVQYLDFFDREKSAEVRKEMASYGFVFPNPPDIKNDAPKDTKAEKEELRDVN